MKWFAKKNKFLTRVAALALALFCLMNMGVTAFAVEVEELEDCLLSFSLTDKTGGRFVDDVSVTLLEPYTCMEFTCTLTSGDYLFGRPVTGNAKQGEYSIALSYVSKGDVMIQNADGTPITSVVLDGSKHNFEWVAILGNEPSAEQPQGEAQVAREDFHVETGNEEADALWNAFVDVMTPIKTDEKYASILKVTEKTSKPTAKYYEKVTGNSAEEYLGMEPFERFLWYSTYIVPVQAISSGDYQYNCGSLSDWRSHGIVAPLSLIEGFGNAEMLEAYDKLMEWDYNYFLENGAVYNFMTGKSSSEEHSIVDVTPSAKPDTVEKPSDGLTEAEKQEVLGSLTAEEKEEIMDAMKDEGSSTETFEKDGIWDGTKALIKDKMFTFVILFVLVGATIGVVAYRKSKNIDDEK